MLNSNNRCFLLGNKTIRIPLIYFTPFLFQRHFPEGVVLWLVATIPPTPDHRYIGGSTRPSGSGSGSTTQQHPGVGDQDHHQEAYGRR
jgi:hypothetical protein